MKYFLQIALLSCFSYLANGQCDTGLISYIHSFDELKSTVFDDFKDEIITARLIGLGEDTHGTHEFTTMIFPLLRYAADSAGYTFLVLETMYGEGIAYDEFVKGKRKDLEFILNNVNSAWRYRTVEFRELLEDIRNYNINHDNQISIHGSEMQMVVADKDIINDYLVEVGKTDTLTKFTGHIWQPYTRAEAVQHVIELQRIEEEVSNNKDELILNFSKEKYDKISDHLRILNQFVTVLLQTNEQRKHDLRDLYMAENILNILSAVLSLDSDHS